MAFTSNLGGSLIIDDSNYQAVVGDGYVDGQQMARGLIERDYNLNPFGSYAPTYDDRETIPRSDWDAMIQEQEETQSTLTHIHEYYKLPVLTQEQLPYCWIFGVGGAMMTARAAAGLSMRHLSPAATGAKIKNYARVGGWAGQAIEGIEKWGMPEVKYWPEAALDRRYDTPEMRENALQYKILKFAELPQQSFDALVTSLLLRRPTTMALMWWGHLVYGLRPVVIERGHYGVEIMNSWRRTWGNNGKAVLAENKATPHEAISVRAVTATNGLNHAA